MAKTAEKKSKTVIYPEEIDRYIRSGMAQFALRQINPTDNELKSAVLDLYLALEKPAPKDIRILASPKVWMGKDVSVGGVDGEFARQTFNPFLSEVTKTFYAQMEEREQGLYKTLYEAIVTAFPSQTVSSVENALTRISVRSDCTSLWVEMNLFAAIISGWNYMSDVLGIQNPRYEALRALQSLCYGFVLTAETVYVIQAPSRVRLNGAFFLHCLEEPALAWADGYEVSSVEGVLFDTPDSVQVVTKLHNGTITAMDALSITDIDRRAAIIKSLGVEELCTALEAELVDTGIEKYWVWIDPGDAGNKTGGRYIYRTDNKAEASIVAQNRLYHVKKFFPTEKYFLRYQDVSTGKDYVSFVTPLVRELAQETGTKGLDADGVMAKKHHMSKQEYVDLRMEG